MQFIMEATIRTHYKRLHKFVKLVDYLVLDSKIAMINISTKDIIKKVNDFNGVLGGVEDKSNFASMNSSWIIVEASIRDDELFYTPNKKILTNIFDEIVKRSV